MASRVSGQRTMSLTSPSRLSVYLNRRLLYGLLHATYLIRRLAEFNRNVFVVPSPPSRWHLLWLIAAYLGVRITSKPEESSLGCIHEDRTWVEPRSNDSGWPKVVLNSRCLDISKRRVAEVNRQILGYNCNVDPTKHVGPMVRKSNINGRHDGQIISGPIDKEDLNCVYQTVIDHLTTDGVVAEYRLLVMGTRIPLAMIKVEHLPAGSKVKHRTKEEPSSRPCRVMRLYPICARAASRW